jgi:hypothetical protein
MRPGCISNVDEGFTAVPIELIRTLCLFLAIRDYRIHLGPFMSAEYKATTVGWTLGEALRRTADRSLLKRLNLATLDERPATDELNQLETAIWMYVREGRLVATGSIRGAAPKVLIPEYASDCQVANWQESTVKHHNKRAITIQGVRIHPTLRAPNAVNRLAGMSLADAFRRFVLDDPEVAALNELQRDSSSLKKGMRPGPFVVFHWPLNLTAEELAFEYVRPIMYYLGDPSPTPSAEQVEISFVLVDRLNALRDLLASGHVTAKGTFVQTGEIVSIDALQWKRDGTFIDVLNGDLCFELKSNPVPIWSGLSFLSAGNGSFQKRPLQNKSGKLKISAHFSSVREATYAEWPDGVPSSLMRGSRAEKIIAWQKAHIRTIVSEKTIERYFKKYGSLHRQKAAR